jgi:hypothetical protein
MSKRIGKQNIRVDSFDSTTIDNTTFIAEKNQLIVSFLNGRSYKYENVDEDTYMDMVYSDSVGRYFNQNIKGNYSYSEIKDSISIT